MEEFKYPTLGAYFDNTIENSLGIYNNVSIVNSQDNITYSQSEQEIADLNSYYKNNNELLTEKFMININTLQSLRISHSLEKSKNTQTLIDLLNGVKTDIANRYNNDSIINDKNIYSNNIKENEKKKYNINKNELESDNNSNIKIIYNPSNIDDSNEIKNDRNKTKFLISNSKINLSINNKDDNIKKSNNKRDNIKECSKDNNLTNQLKIEEIFKEKFEEKISPNKSIKITDGSFKFYNFMSNKNNGDILKPKTFDNKDEIYYFNYEQNSSNDFYEKMNISTSHKIEEEKNKDNSSNEKEKEIENNKIKYRKIDLNDIICPAKNKELIVSNIEENYNKDSIERNNDIDDIDEDEVNIGYEYNNINNNYHKFYKLDKEKKDLILGAFSNDVDLDEDKNIMISDLNIKISSSLKKNNNDKKLGDIKKDINKIKLEKEFEKKKIFKCEGENVKKKTLYNYYKYYSKNQQNKNNKSKTKKSYEINHKITKKIRTIKNYSYNNIKKINKEEENSIYGIVNKLKKKYKNGNSPAKIDSNNKKKINDSKNNFSNNSVLNYSNILSSSKNKKIKNKINKKIIYETERNKTNKSPFSSSSFPKKKKLKTFYSNYPHKKNNYTLSKNIKNNFTYRNKTNCFKSINSTNCNSNISNKEAFIMNAPFMISSDNKSRENVFNNIYRNNISFNNKNNYYDSSKEFSVSSRSNNSYITKIMNNSSSKKINLIKYSNNNINKNKKKNDIPICSINKNKNKIKIKIPFKKKIMGLKKKDTDSSNVTINKERNSLNNIIVRSNSYKNQIRQKISKIKKTKYINHNFHNPLYILYKNKINNTNYNSYKKNINNNNINVNNSQKLKNIKISNKNRNYSDNNSLLITNKTFNSNKLEKKLFKNNKNSGHKLQEKLLTDFNCFNKNFQFMNKMLKIMLNNKTQRQTIKHKNFLEKNINNNYNRNIYSKNNSLNINSFHSNINEKKHKLRNVLMTINNKNKAPYSCRNNTKSSSMEGEKHFHKILNNNKRLKK